MKLLLGRLLSKWQIRTLLTDHQTLTGVALESRHGQDGEVNGTDEEHILTYRSYRPIITNLLMGAMFSFLFCSKCRTLMTAALLLTCRPRPPAVIALERPAPPHGKMPKSRQRWLPRRILVQSHDRKRLMLYSFR